MITSALLALAILAAADRAMIAQPPERDVASDGVEARHDVCHALATGTAPLDLADCFHFDRAPELEFRTTVCDFLDETGQIEDFGFKSRSGCIRQGFAKTVLFEGGERPFAPIADQRCTSAIGLGSCHTCLISVKFHEASADSQRC
jgi:hypothetical protein